MLVFFSACAPSIKKNHYIQHDLSVLTIGTTSKKEVLKYFGLPHKIFKSKEKITNNEFWIYLKDSVTTRTACVPPITTFSGTAATSIFLHSPAMSFDLGMPAENVLACLQFDDSGILIDIIINKGIEK